MVRWGTHFVLLRQMFVGIQQREVPGLDSSSFLTVGIISSCLPGIVDVVSGRNTRGENALKCQSISK